MSPELDFALIVLSYTLSVFIFVLIAVVVIAAGLRFWNNRKVVAALTTLLDKGQILSLETPNKTFN